MKTKSSSFVYMCLNPIAIHIPKIISKTNIAITQLDNRFPACVNTYYTHTFVL